MSFPNMPNFQLKYMRIVSSSFIERRILKNPTIGLNMDPKKTLRPEQHGHR